MTLVALEKHLVFVLYVLVPTALALIFFIGFCITLEAFATGNVTYGDNFTLLLSGLLTTYFLGSAFKSIVEVRRIRDVEEFREKSE